MATGHYALGIDFGTSSTVAVLRWPTGRMQPLLFDGSPLLPSAVFAPGLGRLETGRDALHHGRFDPARLEPNPKRRVDEYAVLLGGREVAVVDMFAAVLERVVAAAVKITSGPVPPTAVTYPAGWAAPRRAVLAEAARRAGIIEPALVPEPVAAASRYEDAIPVGRSVVVYDLGAGTFDVGVVVRGASGYEAAAFDGLDDVGGIDLDEALATHVRDHGGYREPVDLQARQALRDEVRVAKEMLSTTSTVALRNASIGLDAHVTRDEFEAVVQPLLARTVHTTLSAMRFAGTEVAAVLMVGGGSRIPLAGTMLHRATGMAPHMADQPELTVAEGALLSVPDPADRTRAQPRPPDRTQAAAAPPPTRPTRTDRTTPAAPAGGANWPARLLVGAAVLLVLLGGAGYGVYRYLDRPAGASALTADQRRILDSLAGHWTSPVYGDCYIKTDDGVFRMVYTFKDGRVYAELDEDKLVGWWNQVESGTAGQNPEGRVEFTVSSGDGRPGLDGRWRFGTSGSWNRDWELSYVDNVIPPRIEELFRDGSRFRKGP
jgi:actin-like ATPase involved in cell morphogenesis